MFNCNVVNALFFGILVGWLIGWSTGVYAGLRSLKAYKERLEQDAVVLRPRRGV